MGRKKLPPWLQTFADIRRRQDYSVRLQAPWRSHRSGTSGREVWLSG